MLMRSSLNDHHHCYQILELHYILQIGAHGRIRTCNPQLRRLMLYPVELRVQTKVSFYDSMTKSSFYLVSTKLCRQILVLLWVVKLDGNSPAFALLPPFVLYIGR